MSTILEKMHLYQVFQMYNSNSLTWGCYTLFISENEIVGLMKKTKRSTLHP